MRTIGAISFLLLGVVLLKPIGVFADEARCAGPTAPGYLVCAQDCRKDFPFSEHTDTEFAQFRTTCIEGCGQLCDENASRYQSCYMQCKELFKFRHSMRSEFAEFQNMCIAGCRYVH